MSYAISIVHASSGSTVISIMESNFCWGWCTLPCLSHWHVRRNAIKLEFAIDLLFLFIYFCFISLLFINQPWPSVLRLNKENIVFVVCARTQLVYSSLFQFSGNFTFTSVFHVHSPLSVHNQDVVYSATISIIIPMYLTFFNEGFKFNMLVFSYHVGNRHSHRHFQLSLMLIIFLASILFKPHVQQWRFYLLTSILKVFGIASQTFNSDVTTIASW